MRNQYIIQDTRKDNGRTFYVCAPPGHYRQADGKIVSDGCFKGGPEWTEKRAHAHIFTSHRSAARTANKCMTAKIIGTPTA